MTKKKTETKPKHLYQVTLQNLKGDTRTPMNWTVEPPDQLEVPIYDLTKPDGLRMTQYKLTLICSTYHYKEIPE